MARTLLIANPSCDVYGADLQMLESVAGARAAGWRVVVTAPTDGPLRPRLEALGAEVRTVDYPVLRRADASAGGVLRLGGAAAASFSRMRRVVRDVAPDVLYVNTVTLPWWLAVGRSMRVPTLCHVHEAEPDEKRVVQRAMAAPLHLATRVVVNSRVSGSTLWSAAPRLEQRTTLVHNGVEGPPRPPQPAIWGDPVRLVTVGRLSPRKGPDVALEALALLRARGRSVVLELCGTPVPDQSWFSDELEARAGRPDLAGSVTFAGYTAPIWPALQRADVVLAPARAEPFGNAVVEAQLAGRAVVATAQQGHLETIEHGVTGLHVPTDDAEALADAVTRLIDDPAYAQALADAGRRNAETHFSSERYRSDLVAVLDGLLGLA